VYIVTREKMDLRVFYNEDTEKAESELHMATLKKKKLKSWWRSTLIITVICEPKKRKEATGPSVAGRGVWLLVDDPVLGFSRGCWICLTIWPWE